MADTADFDHDDSTTTDTINTSTTLVKITHNNRRAIPQQSDLAAALQPAKPRTLLTLVRADVQEAPLFVEFSRTAIVTLAVLASFERSTFEAAIYTGP